MKPGIVKKINESYFVWFEQSNRWVLFEEPAWYVNKLLQQGFDKNTISHKCAKKYNLGLAECSNFVSTLCNNIKDFCSTPPQLNEYEINSDYTTNSTSKNYAVRYYLIGNKRFILKYSSRLAEYYLHPPLAHLETEQFVGFADEQYEILDQGTYQVLRKNENSENSWIYSDFIRLKKRLFINLTNTIYNKTKADWLTFVHASALTDGKQTVLLSSTSGSGKSTMAALLQTKGLQLVSDDFVPIDTKFKRAFPFPAALSVKHGASSFLNAYYPELRNKSITAHEFSTNATHYIIPNSPKLTQKQAKPVKHIIFIQYNPSKSCDLRNIPSIEAMKLFHEQAWVSGNPIHAKLFINWFLKLKFYSLEYGDTQKGMDTILNIFKGIF